MRPIAPQGIRSTNAPQRGKVNHLFVLGLRLSILGVFVAMLSSAFVGFALFGCQCSNPAGSTRDIEGLTVNPKDPLMTREKPVPILDGLPTRP